MLLHKGVSVPYQLHAWAPVNTELELLDEVPGTELDTDDELERGVLETTLLDEDEDATLDGALEPCPPQIAPVTAGTCARLLPLLPCTPNSTLDPIGIEVFQPTGVAL